jgi:hypothetical protein
MAPSIDWPTGVISIQQSDTSLLTLLSGTLYELDTDALRLALKDLEDSEEGMLWPDTHRHNTIVTISGIAYARTVEIINNYSIQFLPDSQWSVLMDGATNNNYHDVEAGILVQNQVQIIAQNSAGGQVVETATSGLTAQEAADLSNLRKAHFNRFITDPTTGVLTIYDDDDTPLWSGNVYEDEDGLVAYAGSAGIQRRDKLS